MWQKNVLLLKWSKDYEHISLTSLIFVRIFEEVVNGEGTVLSAIFVTRQTDGQILIIL